MNNFASQLIRRARRRAGLSQAQLAHRVGTTQSAIARLERGATSPSFERMHELVNACGFNLSTALEPRPPDNGDADAELGALRRNLSLSYDERVRNVLASIASVIKQKNHNQPLPALGGISWKL